MSRTIPDLPTLLDRSLGELGWDITQLHRKLRDLGVPVSYTSVRNWVAGDTTPSAEYLHWVCRILEIDPAHLLLSAACCPQHTNRGTSQPPTMQAADLEEV